MDYHHNEQAGFSSDEIRLIADQWNDYINSALCSAAINADLFLLTFRDTYKLLSAHDGQNVFSRDTVNLLLLMKEFASYSLFSDTQNDNSCVLSDVTNRLIHQFVSGFRSYGSEYPSLNLCTDIFNRDVINLEARDLLSLDYKEGIPF